MNFFMGGLDVDSLFTNILLEGAIYICTNTLFENLERVGLSKIEFKKLLSLATKKSYFISNEKLYEQVDGMDMSSAFFVPFEKNWLQNCPSDFKTHYYRWYVDDIFVLFTSSEYFIIDDIKNSKIL